MSRPLFDLGQVVATPAALGILEQHGLQPLGLLRRHVAGDWGAVGGEDWRLNDSAVKDGARILSSYQLNERDRVWIITEAADDDGRRLATTLLLPEEY